MKQYFIICILIFFFCSCSKVYWDENWVYQGLVSHPKEQEITVESRPPSAVRVDGVYAGQTPLTLHIPYTYRQISLSRNQYKESGGKKEILDRKIRFEDVLSPGSHTLQFSASGFHDLFMNVEIPSEKQTLNIWLRQKTGIHYPIDCTLKIIAPLSFFPEISGIIRENAISPGIEKQAALPFGPDLYQQTFTFTAKEARALDRITHSLYAGAKNRQIFFTVTDAKTQAAFSANPSREFRAVWISYLDWPRNETDPARQQQQLTQMLDGLQALHINAVLFHVRVECDAYYPTDLAPWARFLTGQQGRNPGYDPLSFAIREAHKRGMELHAWLNPFRARMSQKCGASSSSGHITRTRPDWILNFRWPGACYEMLDPGIPEVRGHLVQVVREIAEKYDVDGIHFDDMFYPYPVSGFPGIRDEDFTTFRKYGAGQSIGDWRRQNVNDLVKAVNTGIKSAKPHVRFGISPFGIRKSGEAEYGMDAYESIYCDALAWLDNKSVDYLAPQLYWKRGGRPDYGNLLNWWAQKVSEAGRHLYPGQIVFYVKADAEWANPEKSANRPESADEIIGQVHLNRGLHNVSVLGNSFYRAISKDDLLIGPENLKKKLSTGFYATPALPPSMPWLDQTPPAPPANLRLQKDQDGISVLAWDEPGPTVIRYAVYLQYRENEEDGQKENTGGLIAVTGEKQWIIGKEMNITDGDLLSVTAVSRNNVESSPVTWICAGYPKTSIHPPPSTSSSR
ncbi:MAG: family 10 glycosylhydrolase [Desulfococcaceae bacterium]